LYVSSGFTLTDRGQLERIICRVFTAGKVPSEVGQKMAEAASATLRQALKDSDVLLGGGTAAATAAGLLAAAVLDVQVTREPPASAGVGDGGGGGGLLLVAQTSTGCLFGTSALLERGVRAEEVGVRAATELIDVLVSGAAVDQW
jgi:RNA 3'-terminal phosphate cyclase (ATP)